MGIGKAQQLPTWHAWPRVAVAIIAAAGLAHSCTASVSSSSASSSTPTELRLTLPPPTWRTASLCLAFLWAVVSMLLRPVEMRSMRSHDNKDARYRAKRHCLTGVWCVCSSGSFYMPMLVYGLLCGTLCLF